MDPISEDTTTLHNHQQKDKKSPKKETRSTEYTCRCGFKKEKQDKEDQNVDSAPLKKRNQKKKMVPLDKELPPLYERISVPQKWMITLLSKCKSKGSSFTVNKMLDGFFEPQDLVGQKASSLRNNKIIQAIRLYIINKIHVKDSDFNGALNSKIHTCKRASTKIIQKK
ncbi:unnamed protein product [Mytilus edulis]|uniref:BEN domain-containing protein n=1 Tax=Mytilus edulis TaxID=6550 RepID=A0A8S3V9S1_MYTED|nr:unnamed protein product [Mytilus edulis]